MTKTTSIHQLKDHLSQVISDAAATGEDVLVTKHGRVVARLVPAPPEGVILGLGVADGVDVPDVEDLRWSDDELAGLIDAPVIPE